MCLLSSRNCWQAFGDRGPTLNLPIIKIAGHDINSYIQIVQRVDGCRDFFFDGDSILCRRMLDIKIWCVSSSLILPDVSNFFFYNWLDDTYKNMNIPNTMMQNYYFCDKKKWFFFCCYRDCTREDCLRKAWLTSKVLFELYQIFLFFSEKWWAGHQASFFSLIYFLFLNKPKKIQRTQKRKFCVAGKSENFRSDWSSEANQ